jgi:hypothetical protein
MNARQLIDELLPTVVPNASVADVQESEAEYHVAVVGTTGVTAECRIPRPTVDDAIARAEARPALASLLKTCADLAVAPVPDGRA